MRIRRRQKKKRENDWKQFVKLRSAEKRSIARWKKNEKKCVRRLETK